MVFPLMTTADRDAFTAVQGQCIYNTTLSMNCDDGVTWIDNNQKNIDLEDLGERHSELTISKKY